MARWRAVVDWAKSRPWALRFIEPFSSGRGRFRIFDSLLDNARRPAMRPDFSQWHTRSLAACWLGHATVLLRIDGLTILTDPVFSPRVGLGWGLGTLGPQRFVRPPVSLRDLPHVDVILISHAHFDHLDRPTLARLGRRSTRVVCAPGTADLLDDLGFGRVDEVDIGESVNIGTSATITACPTRHWGARIVLDNDRGHCAMLIASRQGRRVLYGADTAYHEAWKTIGAAGGVDLGIVGIGAYDPWIEGHANPEQAWTMAALHAGARRVLPMHHLTFKLSQEPMDEPLARMLSAAGERAADVVCRRIGECWSSDET